MKMLKLLMWISLCKQDGTERVWTHSTPDVGHDSRAETKSEKINNEIDVRTCIYFEDENHIWEISTRIYLTEISTYLHNSR